MGFILLQLGADNKCYPSHFGSITWNERESHYSQAKIEIYGLWRALQAYRLYVTSRNTPVTLLTNFRLVPGHTVTSICNSQNLCFALELGCTPSDTIHLHVTPL